MLPIDVDAKHSPIEECRKAADVWTVPLDSRSGQAAAECRALLSGEERRRAERVIFPVHRERFKQGRAAVRRILSTYAGIAPQLLQFGYGCCGKPALRDFSSLHFNVSRTEAVLVCAVSRAGSVGINIEIVRPMPDLSAIAGKFFSRLEVNSLRELDAGDRVHGFFRCWTRKEVFLKSTGDGLCRSLSSFAVSLDPDRASLLWLEDDPDGVGQWAIASFAHGEHAIGAVVVNAPQLLGLSFRHFALPAPEGRGR